MSGLVSVCRAMSVATDDCDRKHAAKENPNAERSASHFCVSFRLYIYADECHCPVPSD